MSQQRLQRERLLHHAADVLEVAGRLGRVMLTASGGGATHERMGPVDRIERSGLALRLAGVAHDADIDTTGLGAVILDRSGRMKDKVLPRLDFHGKDGGVRFSLVGLDGLEPFDAGIAGLRGMAAEAAEPVEPAARAEVAEGDPGAIPFEVARCAGVPVTIELRRDGLRQAWSGSVEAVKPAMGFINVMQPDFHLHLRAGAVGRWRLRADRAGLDGVELLAENARGELIGLAVRGPAAVLARRD
ncbi:hypothetical protein RNI52_29495 [Labrys neptuniae]|uniref:Haemin-degrading HemS/ChuX domain-containing protein n=1 Tax=Labrys neptuniae TaxID=376174 RepID=A0ABV3PS90_9HYPH|nr:hypothetical protein [Labrys neptuniae]MDT3381496.1 hypothetical protein [Labrys neptuniae]